MSISVGHRRFNYPQCPNLNLREISESESEANSTHSLPVHTDSTKYGELQDGEQYVINSLTCEESKFSFDTLQYDKEKVIYYIKSVWALD